jgi:hypothetical protein
MEVLVAWVVWVSEEEAMALESVAAVLVFPQVVEAQVSPVFGAEALVFHFLASATQVRIMPVALLRRIRQLALGVSPCPLLLRPLFHPLRLRVSEVAVVVVVPCLRA